MKSLTEFSDLDFEILEFVCKNEPVSIEKIKKNFSKISSIEYRIKELSRRDFDEKTFSYIPNTSVIVQKYENHSSDKFTEQIAVGTYESTDYGKNILQDFKNKKQIQNKELWLKNAWIPIIVAFLTTLIINYILPTLPYLLKLLVGILSKIV